MEPPDWEDMELLEALANHTGLGSYPALRDQLNNFKAQYRSYIEYRGDPWRLAPLQIDEQLSRALIRHYEDPPQLLQCISAFRDQGADLVCAMCGAENPTTLDHVLPKGTYPEFAFLGSNLVPACACNVQRNDWFKGDLPGERVLHPYFDEFLRHRIAVVRVAPPFDVPALKIEACLVHGAPMSAIMFHLDVIARRTSVLRFLGKMWGQMSLNASAVLGDLRSVSSEHELAGAVRTACIGFDNFYGTPNNWKSMLLAGLEADQAAIGWLYERIEQLRVIGGPIQEYANR